MLLASNVTVTLREPPNEVESGFLKEIWEILDPTYKLLIAFLQLVLRAPSYDFKTVGLFEKEKA